MSAIIDQLAAGIRTKGDALGLAAAYETAYTNLCDVVDDAPHLAGEAVEAFNSVLGRLHDLEHGDGWPKPLDQVLAEVDAALEFRSE